MHPTSLQNARTHNLKNVSLTLEPGTLTVIAGVSGAGKSALAIDTLYAEGQRRFVESFSPYARQFLERRDRPPVDSIDPVPAAIAVDRGAPVRTSRSTVGTMTELQDYLRLLWARASTIHCDRCHLEVSRGTVETALRVLFDPTREEFANQRVLLTCPLKVTTPEAFVELQMELRTGGYRRLWLDGAVHELESVAPSQALTSKSLELVLDRITLRATERGRVAEAIQAAFARAARVIVRDAESKRVPSQFVQGLVCVRCGTSHALPSPALFSFHSPLGACETCKGFGRVLSLDWDKVVPDTSLSIAAGAIKAWSGKRATRERTRLNKLCEAQGIPTRVPWKELKPEQQHLVLHGSGRYPGVSGWFSWLETKAYKMHVRVFLARFRKQSLCTSCNGSRLRQEVSRYRVAGLSLAEANGLPVLSLLQRLDTLQAPDAPTVQMLRETRARLGYLRDVGLGYLSLDRTTRTLSGGEVQRVSLTAALGTALTGTLMVLDEPTVGLHPRDVDRLLGVARGLASLGNIALVVEHDLDVIRAADRVIELGPGAGERGGSIVFDGTPAQLANVSSATGRALRDTTMVHPHRRTARGEIAVRGACGNNLRNVDAVFPLGVFTAVTGVSGSGKSTLVHDTLYPAALRSLGLTPESEPLPYREFEVQGVLKHVVMVDQTPLARTSRGCAATYVKAWDVLRTRLASLPESKSRGYSSRTFSFNVSGGRCPECEGEGFETVEMQFLADVSFQCPACRGQRFQDEVLEVQLEGLSAAQLLRATANDLCTRMHDDASLMRTLRPLVAVGLGYLALGQPLSTLSGGELQRLKLARALSDVGPDTLVILDEPTAGLHRDDVNIVLQAIHSLLDRGCSVIAVEHDPYVVAYADHVIDLGPEAGEDGGTVVVAGRPEVVAKHTVSRMAGPLARALSVEVEEHKPKRQKKPAHDPLPDAVVVEGAAEHNLQIERVEVPRGKLVALTGPSGSGKSSLAFDVIYAEGQRRFLETLSPYARQYLPSLARADVDRVQGIPPAISLEQRLARAGAMSTVATVTEISHFLRLLFAKAGDLYCPKCNIAITAQNVDTMLEHIVASSRSGGEVEVWAPVVQGRKGLHKDVLERARTLGLTQALVDGERVDPQTPITLKRGIEHDISLRVAVAARSDASALRTAIEQAISLAQGSCSYTFTNLRGRKQTVHTSTRRNCPSCGEGLPELDPRHFSFHTRQGQCATCEGMGVLPTGRVCSSCSGSRLNAIARSVRFAGETLPTWMALTPSSLLSRASEAETKLSERQRIIAQIPLKELKTRLQTLVDLGLEYLTLDRAANTLSGGEMQRLRLAAQIGTGLTGVLYVLDEPTIGLHGRDTQRLVHAMKNLVARGASVLVVEHDTEVIASAEHVIELGPGGGRRGGHIVSQGTAEHVLTDDNAPTARALRNDKPATETLRSVESDTPRLRLTKANGHNLKAVTLEIPLGRLVCVAGVSGSGKSSLITQTLVPALKRSLKLEAPDPLPFETLEGHKALRAVKEVDQSPIGRTPRSVPATYIGIWDDLRTMFATTELARSRGWSSTRFSFNTTTARGGGRCEHCEGAGTRTVEMSFLPDIQVVCEVCQGARFTRETCEVTLHHQDPGQVLQLSVDEALETFAQAPRIARPLQMLSDLGLGYLALGQGSHTLSGGEAQRVKLAAEMQSRSQGTLYVLDEPTTGLHLGDVARLIRVLQALVARGDSVVVIEHNPSVLAVADWVIELGPNGGADGGRIVAATTPRALAKHATPTGQLLHRHFAQRRANPETH